MRFSECARYLYVSGVIARSSVRRVGGMQVTELYSRDPASGRPKSLLRTELSLESLIRESVPRLPSTSRGRRRMFMCLSAVRGCAFLKSPWKPPACGKFRHLRTRLYCHVLSTVVFCTSFPLTHQTRMRCLFFYNSSIGPPKDARGTFSCNARENSSINIWKISAPHLSE